ncbi:MAG TPA: EcsC family protein [Candidatus Acidoferrales bacterium]|nr:EcsC family protein [Candidatus Acidoferrales bacterium]
MARRNEPEAVRHTAREDAASLREDWEWAKGALSGLGGWAGLKSGSWFYDFARSTFRTYYERATPEYLQEKYPGKDAEFIADKLISIAAKNAMLLGSVTGAAISADELAGLLTAGEGGVGIPANILLGLAAAGAELVLLVRFQLQMVAGLARIYGVDLDPDDPEDVLTIFTFALGGSIADRAGRLGMRVGARATRRMVEKQMKREMLAPWKLLGERVGARLASRSLAKYAVPMVSVGIGAAWNYAATRGLGRLARRHFQQRARRDSMLALRQAEG